MSMPGEAAPVPVTVRVDRMDDAEDLPLPAYRSAGAAGLDLAAAVPVDAPVTLAPGSRALVRTGLMIEIPPGFEGQVRPRSGLAANHGVTVLNAPGTIDSDYRGEVKVLLANFGEAPVLIGRGMRIAQLVVAPVARATLVLTDTLEATGRAAGGFGSTGL